MLRGLGWANPKEILPAKLDGSLLEPSDVVLIQATVSGPPELSPMILSGVTPGCACDVHMCICIVSPILESFPGSHSFAERKAGCKARLGRQEVPTGIKALAL